MARVSIDETTIGPLLFDRLDFNLVLVQPLRIDRTSSVRSHGLLLEPEPDASKRDVRPCSRSILHSCMVTRLDDVNPMTEERLAPNNGASLLMLILLWRQQVLLPSQRIRD